MQPSRRSGVVISTVAFFVVEWLLFELIRIPYHPPDMMLTFLGQEKYWVIGFMGLIAIGWWLYVVWVVLSRLPSLKDAIAFLCLITVLTAVAAAIVLYPPWPVTPFNLLIH